MIKGKKVELEHLQLYFGVMFLVLVLAFFIFPSVANLLYTGKKIPFLDWYTIRVQRAIYSLRYYRFILLEMILIICVVLFAIWLWNNEKARINRLLARFIKNNNLVIYEVKNNKRRIREKADIYFIYNKKNNSLVVNCFLHGTVFDDKLKNAREKLEDLFSCGVSEVYINYSIAQYTFNFTATERLKKFKYENDVVRLDCSLVWDYNKSPHGLIIGGTGSGKTYFTNYLICNLLYQKASLTFLDPKWADIKSIGDVVNADKTACDENNIARLVREFKEEMEYRQKLIADFNKTGATYKDLGLKPNFLIFDELAAFKAGVKEKKTFTDVEANIRKIILMGRSTGNFVILITQQPNAENISTEIRDQLGLKIAFGNIQAETKRMIFNTAINLHTFKANEKGAGYVSLNNSEPIKFLAPNLGANYDFVEEIKKLKML